MYSGGVNFYQISLPSTSIVLRTNIRAAVNSRVGRKETSLVKPPSFNRFKSIEKKNNFENKSSQGISTKYFNQTPMISRSLFW